MGPNKDPTTQAQEPLTWTKREGSLVARLGGAQEQGLSKPIRTSLPTQAPKQPCKNPSSPGTQAALQKPFRLGKVIPNQGYPSTRPTTLPAAFLFDCPTKTTSAFSSTMSPSNKPPFLLSLQWKTSAKLVFGRKPSKDNTKICFLHFWNN